MDMVVRAMLAAFYDGSAASAGECLSIVQQITANQATWTIESQPDETLILRETQGVQVTNWPVLVGRWLVVACDFGIIARLPDETFVRDYRTLETLAIMLQNTAGMRKLAAVGLGAIPSLALNSSSPPIAVDIYPPVPPTGLTVTTRLVGLSSLLASLSVTSAVPVTNPSTGLVDTVNVVVRNSGLLTINGTFVLVRCV